MFTVVCGGFWHFDKIKNGGRCHVNQGAEIVKIYSKLQETLQ